MNSDDACSDRRIDPSTGGRLFVLGDAHLHPRAEPAIADDLQRLVENVTERHPGACIVFNGDAFDLDRVDGERAAGIGEHRAAQRVARVLDAVPRLTESLRCHVAAGGTLLFVAGNHDAEILLPAVRAVLEDRLDPGSHPSRVRAIERLDLPQLLVQHGHQADPDSAFFPNTRIAIAKGRLSALPLASLMTRLFVSSHPRYDSARYHQQPPLPVFLGVLRNYKLAGLAMAVHFPIVALRIAWQSLLARLRRDAPRVDGSNSMASPWTVIRRLYLDRYVGTCLAVALLAVNLLGAPGNWTWWVFGALCLYLLMPPPRRKVFAGRDVRKCASEAASLAGTGARVVVFGHTHRAFVTRLGKAIYANHGAFSLPVEVDGEGRVCGEGGPADPSVTPDRRGRPYLAVSVDPPACELCTLQTPLAVGADAR